ncbi:uncharacterized protein LOC135833331 [Planococcus citri]|uniref:uncharacterized protein LOC135833331 n=1 Tax=Planococcus citri TaxID=170843 RepID=UPI0031F9E24A
MFTKICAIAFIFVDFSNYASGSNHAEEIELSEWKSLTTRSYDYTPIPIDQIKNRSEIYLEFCVKAERDAHIIFSPTKTPAKIHEKAYEIVLGADENKYSAIRLSRQGENIKQDGQHGIISSNSWRNKFWLRISSNGLIEVGKYGNPAFLSWEDKNRMNIDHFGFASWINNNSVNWRIKNTWTKNETKKDLKRVLFLNYGKTVPPKNSTLLDEVNITVTNQYAYERRGALEIVGLAKIAWKDDRLKWNSTSYNNCENIFVEYDSIWKPNITITNDQLCLRPRSLHTGYVILSHEGIVSWVTLLHTKLSCSPKEHFKLSSHQATCPIKLIYIAKKLSLEVRNNFEMPLPSPFFCRKVQALKNEQPEFYAELIFKRQG